MEATQTTTVITDDGVQIRAEVSVSPTLKKNVPIPRDDVSAGTCGDVLDDVIERIEEMGSGD